MKFEIYNIQSSLGNYVESIFYHKDYVPDHNIERVVPTGNIFILFELDNFQRNTFDNELKPNGVYTKAWVSGMHQKYLNISAHQHSEMLIVQLKSTGAYPIFKVAISELNETVKPAEIYFGESILKLRDEITKNSNTTNKFKKVENWLLKLLDENKSAPQDIIDVVTKLQNNPFSKHQELLKDYPKTQKHLISQFRKYAGLSPKSLHRIFRFNKLLEIINQKKEIIWTEIVYETGYADQSHFIKDFQEFCGFNPSKYIKNGYNETIPNFFPLDKRG
ncbi:MAG: AraC family transcriptional regulator [Bacteroidales bacterium]|nr:AraC family transcriptional regulator [Bacteroidales bacterium]